MPWYCFTFSRTSSKNPPESLVRNFAEAYASKCQRASSLDGIFTPKKEFIYSPTREGAPFTIALHTKEEFDGAVEALLCPRHYEYLLFIQNKLETDKLLEGSIKYRQAREVMKIVQEAIPTLPTPNVKQAVEIVEEAVHRLK
jgi:hypothetical protein